MKKLFSLVLALCLTLSMAGSAMAYTLSDNGVLPLTDEKVELDVWTFRGTNVLDMETNTTTLWLEDQTNVHINWTQSDFVERTTKMNISFASGDYPDIYATTLTPENIMMYAGEIFIPIEDLIDQYAPNTKAVLDANPDLRELITAPDGHIYTLFKVDAGAHLYHRNKMFVNTAWLEAYKADGGKLPETTAEFEAMLIYFRDHDMNGNGDLNDEIPFVGSATGWNQDPAVYMMNPFQMVGDDYEWVVGDENGTLYYSPLTDGFREGLRWMNSLYEQGLIAEETYVQDGNQLKALATRVDPKDMIVGAVSAVWQGDVVDSNVIPYSTFTAIPPLAGPTGLRQAPTKSLDVSEITLQCAITTACEDPILAIKWLDTIMAENGADPTNDPYFYYGTEGVDYIWDETKVAINGQTPARVSLESERAETLQNESWGSNTAPSWRTVDVTYNVWVEPTSSTAALYGTHEVYAPYYVYSGIPLQSWSTDADMATEVAELDSMLDNQVKMSVTQFVMGVLDIDNDAQWEQYKNTLEAMGVERYIELRNAQLGN